MDIKKELVAALNKPMDRKGFLKQLLFGLVVLTGIGQALRMLTSKQTNSTADFGYGNSDYGGAEDGKK